MEGVSLTIMEVDTIHMACAHCHVCDIICISCAVGKLRKRWVNSVVGPVAVDMLKAVKANVDPNNIFGCGNLLPQ